MFAQVFPLFQETFHDGFHKFNWVVLPTTYADGTLNGIVEDGAANVNPTAMTVISALALITNIIALGYIIYVSKKRHINPYKEDVFINQKYYKDSMARADVD
jgi:hypothetical protein